MSSLSSAPALILLQVSSRLVTFILNQTLVRLTSPAIFGAANIQLELLLSTILFLSREGVRGALLRTESDPEQSKSSQPSGKERAKHNISLLPVPIGALISLAATYLYTSTASQSLKSQPNFVLSVSLYALGALVELCSEPLYTRAQTQMKVNLRVRAEGLAVLAKCLVTVAAVALPRILNSKSQVQEAGLIAFGLGQAAYGLVTFLVYLRAYLRTDGFKDTKSLLSLEKPSGKSNLFALSYFDPSTLDLAWVMVKQSVLKHLLTEGDKFAVAKLATLSDQGGYALASNYGSLVARMLFQPIEESSRLVFSRELGSVTSESRSNDSQPKSTIKSNFSNSNSLQSASALLSSLFKLYFVLFLFFLTFGPPLSFSLLYVVAGSKWASTSAPKILGAYCYYLPIMGLNGITEAFLQATANQQQLSLYSKIMIFASLSFGLSLWGFSNLDLSSERRGKEVDLVWSSCISLSLRAAWSWRYILNFFKDHREKAKEEKMKLESTSPLDCLPSTPVLLTFLVSASILRWSESNSSIPRVGSIRDLLPHVGTGLLCLAGCLLSCFIFERRSIVNSLSALRGSRSVQTQSNLKSKSG